MLSAGTSRRLALAVSPVILAVSITGCGNSADTRARTTQDASRSGKEAAASAVQHKFVDPAQLAAAACYALDTSGASDETSNMTKSFRITGHRLSVAAHKARRAANKDVAYEGLARAYDSVVSTDKAGFAAYSAGSPKLYDAMTAYGNAKVDARSECEALSFPTE